MKNTTQKTVTYIAEPESYRCQWWSAILTKNILDIKYLEERAPFSYLKRNADLELEEGTFIIDSEAMHHRKSRGYITRLGVVSDGEVCWIKPNIEIKKHIKSKGYQDLMKGSGDVAGCIRMAIYLSRQENLAKAIKELKSL